MPNFVDFMSCQQVGFLFAPLGLVAARLVAVLDAELLLMWKGNLMSLLNRPWVKVVAPILASSISYSAVAVDTQGAGSLSATSHGKVSEATVMQDGRFSGAVHAHSAVAPVSAPGDQTRYMDRSTQAIVMFGAGATKWLEFNLGIRGSQEKLTTKDSSGLFLRELEAEGGKSTEENKGFAGAVVSAKVGLVQDGMFKLSLMPFVETGAGEKAIDSLARSYAPKAGWLMLASIGNANSTELLLNAGYRYRTNEWVDETLLRNEMLYQGLVRAKLFSGLGIFAGGQGRVIRTSELSQLDENGKRQYRNLESGELTGGLSLAMGESNIEFYGGRRANDRSLGAGKTFAGMSLAFAMGSSRRESLASSAKEDKRTAASMKEVGKEEAVATQGTAAATILPAMTEKDYDLFSDVDRMLATELENGADQNDFKAIPKKPAGPNEKKDVGAGAELDRVEAEIKDIRAREAKVKEEDSKREAVEADADRVEARKRYEEQLRAEDEYRKEMRQKIETLPSVTEEDYGWMGLEQ